MPNKHCHFFAGSASLRLSMGAAVQEEFEEEAIVPLERMPHGAVGHTFTLLQRPEGSMALGKLVNILRFKVKEIDPSTGARPPRPQDCTVGSSVVGTVSPAAARFKA